MTPAFIHAWRHPKPVGATGRCIGHTDLPLDRRKAKRLAHRIRQAARQEGLPRVVYTSPLQRCALVGRVLKRWGWRHVVDARLIEVDFGQWDGCPWEAIARQEVDEWCHALLHTRPGGGESLSALLTRAQAWSWSGGSITMVGHAGWMLARQWVAAHPPGVFPMQAMAWPKAPPYLSRWVLV